MGDLNPQTREGAMLARLVAMTLIVGTPLTALAGHPQPFGDGTVRFVHGGGNEWWIEVKVAAAGLRGVEARDDGGPWVSLQLKSWGEWAASFHVESGHRVQFRALGDGFSTESCWFTHPAGVEQCPSGDFDARFSDPGGNEWWVEVDVEANEPLAGVDARIDGGPWRALQLKSWGDWAASYHAPEGSIVQFRARSTGGAEDVSPCWRWTEAALVSCGGVWPREGSFVRYVGVSGVSVPDFAEREWTNVTFAREGSGWTGVCEWHTRRVEGDGPPMDASGTEAAGATGPYALPTDVEVGDVIVATVGDGCGTTAREVVVVDASGDVYRAREPEDTADFQDLEVAWDATTGLVTGWDFAFSRSFTEGALVATDAPVP